MTETEGWPRGRCAYAPHSIEAVVTDPPFGVREFDSDHLAKKLSGSGGNWRIPQTTGGANRKAVPRFCTVTAEESEAARPLLRGLRRTRP